MFKPQVMNRTILLVFLAFWLSAPWCQTGYAQTSVDQMKVSLNLNSVRIKEFL
jgi:hypothetical protein